MKIKYHLAMDVEVEGESMEFIDKKFDSLKLGNLDEEKRLGNILDWKYDEECSSIEEEEIILTGAKK